MNDFESEIRTMLAERSRDIASAPPRLASVGDDSPEGGRAPVVTEPRWSTRWLVAASVAAVLVVAGGVIGVRLWLAGSSGDVPAGPTPTSPVAVTPPMTSEPATAMTTSGAQVAPSLTTAAPTTTAAVPTTGQAAPTTDPSRVTHPPAKGTGAGKQVTAACVAPWPASWQAAIATPGSAYGAQSARPLGAAADGTVLVARDFGPGGARDLVLVRAGTEPEVVYTVADPATTGIQSAAIADDKLVVSVGWSPRAPKGQEPGDGWLPNVTEVVVIDLETGAQQRIASSGASPAQVGTDAMTIDTVVVIGGAVYWDVRASYDDPAGTIESYDLATGTRRTAYTGPAVEFYDGLDTSAAGVTIGGQLVVRADLPAVVDAAVPVGDRGSVQSDGTAYAWVAGSREIGWWRPGAASPSYVRLPEALPQDTYPNLLAVAGPLVVIGGSTVLDMTTAAVTHLPEDAAPLVDIGHGILFTASRVGTGHFDDDGYWVDPSLRANVLELGDLPALACG